MSGIVKHYADTSFGQLHLRWLQAGGEERHPPLICLHPAPSSGLYFETVMPLLADGRQVIAPDYPGYGGSTRQERPPSVANFASAVIDALGFLGTDRPVDLLGFHTGCLVAAEIVRGYPDWVRKLVLCDIPYFDADQRKSLHEKMAQPLPLSADLDCLANAWSFDVGTRIDDVPLPRAFELFVEHLRAGTRDHFAFDAAFRYDCESRFPTLHADVVCLATRSGLHDATVAAANAIRGARLVEVPEVSSAVFEKGAKPIAKRILEAL